MILKKRNRRVDWWVSRLWRKNQLMFFTLQRPSHQSWSLCLCMSSPSSCATFLFYLLCWICSASWAATTVVKNPWTTSSACVAVEVFWPSPTAGEYLRGGCRIGSIRDWFWCVLKHEKLNLNAFVCVLQTTNPHLPSVCSYRYVMNLLLLCMLQGEGASLKFMERKKIKDKFSQKGRWRCIILPHARSPGGPLPIFSILEQFGAKMHFSVCKWVSFLHLQNAAAGDSNGNNCRW